MSKNLQNFIVLADELDNAIETFGNDSEEADAVRDKMDAPWWALTDAEQQQVERYIIEKDKQQ